MAAMAPPEIDESAELEEELEPPPAADGDMHCDTLVDPAEEVAPEGHDLQESPSVYVLAVHLQAEALVDPSGEVWPVGHDLQELPSLYLLAEHFPGAADGDIHGGLQSVYVPKALASAFLSTLLWIVQPGDTHAVTDQSASWQSLCEAFAQKRTLFEVRVPISDFSKCALADRALLEEMPAEGTDCGATEEAPVTSTSNENVFPETSLTSALLESVAQTEIIPIALALMPLLLGGFCWVVTRTWSRLENKTS